MAKRIAYCADGTWQSPKCNTNVYRLYKSLAVTSGQVAYYDDGVGADATGLGRVVQGAFGEGILQKVRDGYTKIAHVYEPGDDIFLFGFSRGAYTARSLAGFIAVCGLPGGSFSDDCIARAFAAYRDPVNRASLLAGLGPCGLTNASIKMIGVWDTVGSLGIPAIFGGIDDKVYGFLDTTLHPNVKNAFHALSIDEKRPQFPATLWTSAPAPGQVMEQVWFSGCHGDVGGGNQQAGSIDAGTRLCDITFGWMLGKAQALGLAVDTAVAAQFASMPAKYALDAINETWKPVDGPPHWRPIPAGSKIANSVAVRVRYGLTYAPANLQIQDGDLAQSYSLVPLVAEDAL